MSACSTSEEGPQTMRSNEQKARVESLANKMCGSARVERDTVGATNSKVHGLGAADKLSSHRSDSADGLCVGAKFMTSLQVIECSMESAPFAPDCPHRVT
jgi:hypothetical protein